MNLLRYISVFVIVILGIYTSILGISLVTFNLILGLMLFSIGIIMILTVILYVYSRTKCRGCMDRSKDEIIIKKWQKGKS